MMGTESRIQNPEFRIQKAEDERQMPDAATAGALVT
jgi:hypothetical protein